MNTVTTSRRSVRDHFEPDEDVDPKVRRQLRGHLEQIDYTAYAANRKVLTATFASFDLDQSQRVAAAAALARTHWVAAALVVAEEPKGPTPGQICALTQLRTAYEELTEVYDAMRRLVERGYLPLVSPQAG